MSGLDRLRAEIKAVGKIGVVLITCEQASALVAVVDEADKLIIGITGDNGLWMDQWCVLSDAVNAVKGGSLTCHDCGRKITDAESNWGACPQCAAKPGHWTEVHDA